MLHEGNKHQIRQSGARRAVPRVMQRVTPVACAVVVAACLVGASVPIAGTVAPQRAWAYYSLAPVSISLGQSSVSVVAGQSVTVSVGLSQLSEQQTVGCGMAECPQACDNMTTPGGVRGGCSDANGWCTCAGASYSTYYTNVAVQSDSPGVARASYNGGALTISGYSPGTATLTLTASLRQHVDNSTTMVVNVTQPAGGGSGTSDGEWVNPYKPTPSGEGGGGAGDASSSAGAGTSGTATGDSGTVSVGGVSVSPAGVPQAAPAQEASDAENVTEIERDDGSIMLVVQANRAANCAEELAKIAGTEGTCTFWVGQSSERPDISWSFAGKDLDAGGNLDMNLGVSVSKKGTGDVARVLETATDSLVMDWQHAGQLPAPAQVFVRVDGDYAGGTQLALFCFNDETKRFERMQDGIVVENGYASFTMDHCSTWALSTDDLTRLTLADEGADGSGDGVIEDIARQNTQGAADGALWAVLIVVVLAVVAVGVFVGVRAVRRRRDQEVEPDVVNEGESAVDEGAERMIEPNEGSARDESE